jgi:UDP-glucose 4-epimerase
MPIDLRGARVLVTGGAGLVGSHVVDWVADEGPAEIVVLDSLVRGRREHLVAASARTRLTFVEGDVRDRQLVADVMRGIDLVFHQTEIRASRCIEEPRLALEVLVDGTFNVVEAAARAGVKKLVAASSAAVYGMADAFPTPEGQHFHHNRTLYGASKAFIEGVLRSFYETAGLNYVALRYFNVYGPRMDISGAYTGVLIRWMENIAAGIPPLILGDGRQTMDFVFIEDVARANILAARADVTDAAFNVASGREVSLNELADRLLRVMGSDLRPEYGPARQANPVARRVGDVRAAREALGFEARVGLDEGLARLVGWWRVVRTPVEAVRVA